jgi:hypothetical protein
MRRKPWPNPYGGKKLMEDSDQETPTNYAGLIIFLCTLPVSLTFMYFGKAELGMNVGICLFTLVSAVGMCWELRKYLWFWTVVGLLLVLHVPLLLMIHWPPHMWVSKIVLLPIGLADLAFDVGVIRFVQKFIMKTPSVEEEA